MDNLKFYTKQDLDETSYYYNLIKQPGWEKRYFEPNLENPNRSRFKYCKIDKETELEHYLYFPESYF